MVKQSYSCATSTSAGPRPDRAQSSSATARDDSEVMLSRISTGNMIPGCVPGRLACATAWIRAAPLRQSRARAALVTTTAAAPSVSRQ